MFVNIRDMIQIKSNKYAFVKYVETIRLFVINV